VNNTLVAWAMRKFQRFKNHKTRAGRFFERLSTGRRAAAHSRRHAFSTNCHHDPAWLIRQEGSLAFMALSWQTSTAGRPVQR